MADVRVSMKNFQEHLKQTREQIQITHPLLKLTSTEFLISLIVENISSYDLVYKESHLNLLVKGASLHSMMTSTLEGRSCSCVTQTKNQEEFCIRDE